MKTQLLTNVLPSNVEDRRNDPAGAQRFDQGVAPNRGRGDATFRSDAFGQQLPYVGSDYYVAGPQFNGQLLKDNENPRLPTATSQAISALPVLSLRSKDTEAVMAWQRFLNEQGVGDPLEVDGVFGGKTAAATRALQKRLGVRADGIVGLKTRNAVVEAVSMPMPRLRPDGGLPALPADELGTGSQGGMPMPTLRPPTNTRHISGFEQWQKDLDPKWMPTIDMIAGRRGVPVQTYLYQLYQHAARATVRPIPTAADRQMETWKANTMPEVMDLVNRMAKLKGISPEDYLTTLYRRTTSESLALPKLPAGQKFDAWTKTIDPAGMELIGGVAKLKNLSTDQYLREIYAETVANPMQAKAQSQ